MTQRLVCRRGNEKGFPSIYYNYLKLKKQFVGVYDIIYYIVL